MSLAAAGPWTRQPTDGRGRWGLGQDLAKQQLLELADAAWVERTADGKVKLHQSVNLTAMMAGSGAVTGALWGTLIGLLFLNPLAGAAVGAGVGAGTGAIAGIDRHRRKRRI